LYEELMAEAAPYCKPEEMDAEDPLFILYTQVPQANQKVLFTLRPVTFSMRP
jgi:hypothetical protein